MKYNPDIHHRRSIRLKGYDYCQPGAFFVTICTQNRSRLFGRIRNGKMELNYAGQMVMKWYHELENKFPDIKIDECICMPNHIHFIVVNDGVPAIGTGGNVGIVGADLCVCPGVINQSINPPQSQSVDYIVSQSGEHMGSPLRCVCPGDAAKSINPPRSQLDDYIGAKSDDHIVSQTGEHVGVQQGENIESKSGEHVGSPLRRVWLDDAHKSTIIPKRTKKNPSQLRELQRIPCRGGGI